MAEQYAVSIIIPVFNTEKYLRECLDSVCRSEGFSRYEVLLIDDGSTDGSTEIMREYAKRYPNIVLPVYDGPPWNRGPGAARNLGLRHARGQYIAFMDSDDRVLEQYHARLLERIRDTDADIVFAGFSMWTDQGVTPYRRRVLESSGCFPGVDFLRARKKCRDGEGYSFCALYRASLLRENAITFEENINLCEDVLFTLRAALAAKRVSVMSEYGYIYRQRPVSLVHSGQPLRDAENEIRVLEKFAEDERYRTDPVAWYFCVDIMSMCLYNLGLARDRGQITKAQHDAYYRRISGCVDWQSMWKNAESIKNRSKLALWRLDWRAFYPLVRKRDA